MSLGTNTTGATLGGTLTVNAVNGIASFRNLTVNFVGNYTLCASATGLPSVTGNSFSISAAK